MGSSHPCVMADSEETGEKTEKEDCISRQGAYVYSWCKIKAGTKQRLKNKALPGNNSRGWLRCASNFAVHHKQGLLCYNWVRASVYTNEANGEIISYFAQGIKSCKMYH